MTLRDALQGIAKNKYYEFCGYTYRVLDQHGDLEYDELNASLQRGIHTLIQGIYNAQKMVYHYDLDYVVYHCKQCGIKFSEILRRCNILDRRCSISNEQRKCVRIELIRITIRLIDYTIKKGRSYDRPID